MIVTKKFLVSILIFGIIVSIIILLGLFKNKDYWGAFLIAISFIIFPTISLILKRRSELTFKKIVKQKGYFLNRLSIMDFQNIILKLSIFAPDESDPDWETPDIRIPYIINGNIIDNNFVLLDCEYTRLPYGYFRELKIALFELKSLDFPEFSLFPRRKLWLPEVIRSYRELRLDNSEFSKKYILYGKDEFKIKRIIQPNIIVNFPKFQDVAIERVDNWLVFYDAITPVKLEKLTLFLDQCNTVFEALKKNLD